MQTFLRFLICSMFLSVKTGSGSDWPSHHGPTHDGHAPEEVLFETWPVAGPRVAWTCELGQGYSGFVIVGERCLTQYQSPLGQFVLCLNVTTGERLWQHRYDHPYEAIGIYPGPRSTPLIWKNKVYFISPVGLLGCLSLTDGHEIWSVNINETFGGKGTEFGYSASPMIVDDVLYLPVGGPDASVIALNATDGGLRWKQGSDSASYCPSTPIELDGETLIVNYLENVITIHSLDGELHWRSTLSTGYDEHSVIPIFASPFLIFSAPFKAGATAYQLEWIDDGTSKSLQVKEAWHCSQMSNDVVSSIVVDEMFCGFDLKDPQSKAHRPSRGTYRAINTKTGDVIWSNDRLCQASAILASNGSVHFNDRGEIFLTRLSREGCEVLAEAEVFKDQVCWTRPSLADGRMIVRSHERAVCLLVGPQTSEKPSPTVTRSLADIPQTTVHQWHHLLGGEREHPFMLPSSEELFRWMTLSLYYCLFPAILISAHFVFWNQMSGVNSLRLMSLMTVLLGACATPLLNTFREPFQFTWPVSVFGMLQWTVLECQLAGQDRSNLSQRRRSWLSVLGLSLLGLTYFWILREASEPVLWAFQLGMATGAPIAILTVKCATTQPWGNNRSNLITSLFFCLSFLAFYWGAILLQYLRTLYW